MKRCDKCQNSFSDMFNECPRDGSPLVVIAGEEQTVIGSKEKTLISNNSVDSEKTVIGGYSSLPTDFKSGSIDDAVLDSAPDFDPGTLVGKTLDNKYQVESLL